MKKMGNDTILLEEADEDFECVPVCGGNLASPVTDAANYIGEIRYRVGSRLYIENAD